MKSRGHQSGGPALNVFIVSPVPPPYGGIASWTSMILAHSTSHGRARLTLIDTSLRWRSPNSKRVVWRIIGGVLEAFRVLCGLLLAALRQQPDVIHLNCSGGLGIGRDFAVLVVARLLRVPVVYHLRFGRVPAIAAVDAWEWRALARAIQSASDTIAIDAATFSVLSRRLPLVRCHLVPNCVDTENIAVRSEVDSQIVLFVGSISPSKGLADLISAWNSAWSPGWRLVLIGQYRESYREQLLKSSDNADSIALLGGLPHAQTIRHMRESEILVLPSHTEGFPNVVVEAMAHGLPVVATAVGAVPEILGDGAGIEVPPRDPQALSAALTLLMGDQPRRAELGDHARRKVRSSYSLQIIYPMYERIWQDAGYDGS